jgi:dienelactone hydrolase
MEEAVPKTCLVLIAGAVLLCAALAPAAGAEPSGASAPRLVRQAYPSTTGQERDVYVYLPVGYDSDAARRWPLLLFLHGDGERGDGKADLDWVTVHGPIYEAWTRKRDLPFVVVAPQLDLFGRDETVPYIKSRDASTIPRRQAEGVPPRPEEFPTPQPMTGATVAADVPIGPEGPPDGWPRREQDFLTILDLALEDYRVDPRRVYLTGLSYGGFGTWYLASRHARRFAAIAPVVGWGHPDLMPPLAERRVPIWVFAGGRDPVVPVRYFYPGLNKLEELGHKEMRFTVHEDMGHDTWARVYGGQDVYDWLLSHRLDADPPASAAVEPAGETEVEQAR